MCILLKLHYEKFDVSSLFCSNVIEEKPLGGRLLVKERLTIIYMGRANANPRQFFATVQKRLAIDC